MHNINYVNMYKTFLNLRDSENDLDVIEELAENLQGLEAIASSNIFEMYEMVTDDTTLAHMEIAVSAIKELLVVAQPLVDDFLGISQEQRKTLLALFPKFLVSYGIILYKSYGYELIANQYALTNTVDTSVLTLPPELLDKVSRDLSGVIETISTIVVVFQTFKAYFAEYQISDSQDLYDVISHLEDLDFDTDKIGRISEAEVDAYLREGGYR